MSNIKTWRTQLLEIHRAETDLQRRIELLKQQAQADHRPDQPDREIEIGIIQDDLYMLNTRARALYTLLENAQMKHI